MRKKSAFLVKSRHYLYELLEATPHGSRGGLIVNRLIGGLIVLSVGATIFDTVPQFHSEYGTMFGGIEALSLAAFTIEYCLRIWIAPVHIPYHDLTVAAARRKYVMSSQGIIDFLAVAPLWVALLGLPDFRVLIVLRILRILKFTRFSSGMNSLLVVLWSERRALGGCLIILMSATLISASVMHVVEGSAQPDKFGTIPDAMWWAIVTLSTIGYGDVVPSTVLGKMIATVTIIGGLIMIALPVGIVATAFSEAIHRRDFIVTWSMVARVPLFSRLTAGDIAHIMQLLRAQQVERGEIIVRRGDSAHSMYFIAEGEVEIELGPDQKGDRVRLGAGHFFGERAVLKKTKRSATISSVTRVKLLVLDAADLTALIAREPSIAEHIHEVAARRSADYVPVNESDVDNGNAA